MESYSSAEMQSVYSIAPPDWVNFQYDKIKSDIFQTVAVSVLLRAILDKFSKEQLYSHIPPISQIIQVT